MNDRESQKPNEDPHAAAGAAQQSQPAEAKRLSARRRFMRMGAGGTAGLMVTVVHKRAFAGKKTTIQSLCGSLAGTPNFIKNGNGAGMTTKKITLSAMGTPKGLVCGPTQPATNWTRSEEGKYWTNSPFGANARIEGSKIYTYEEASVKLGGIDINDTLTKGNEWRLVENGWCPIKLDSNGMLYVEAPSASNRIVKFGERNDPSKWKNCK